MALAQAFARNFLGHAPDWYKLTIVAFLAVNPLVLLVGGADGPVVAGWLLLLEFIFTLGDGAALLSAAARRPARDRGRAARSDDPARRCTTKRWLRCRVILLLVFMVAGIYFLRELLLFTFTKILLGIRSRTALALRSA